MNIEGLGEAMVAQLLGHTIAEHEAVAGGPQKTQTRTESPNPRPRARRSSTPSQLHQVREGGVGQRQRRGVGHRGGHVGDAVVHDAVDQ
jgi:hypothetical protein